MKKSVLENSLGVLYVATADLYRHELQASLASLREWHPSIPVTVITDRRTNIVDVNEILLNNPQYCFMDKVRSLRSTPYVRTIFLDTDTFVCGDLLELYDLLDQFEFAGSHSPGRICSGSCYRISGVPDCFAQFNSGVLAYRNTEAVMNLLSTWQDLYQLDVDMFESLSADVATTMKYPQDQPALREAMYHSEVRIATLPTEYNFRTIFPCYASRPVKIIHGRNDSLRSLANEINNVVGKRVYLPGRGVLTAMSD